MVQGQMPVQMQAVQPPNPTYAPPIANTGVMVVSPPGPTTTNNTGTSEVFTQTSYSTNVPPVQSQNDGPPPQYPGKA